MLRLFILLLVLLNAGYYAWSQGMLRSYGYAPAEQREPQRVQQQIRPESIRILSIDEARRVEQAASTPPKPPECLQAGLLDENQTALVRQALDASLPAGTWVLEPVTEPARWIIYMGKFASNANLERRKAELDKLKIKPEALENPELQPGLSLGHFATRAQAQSELAALQKRGVRQGRVVQERPEVHLSHLRIPAADEAMRARLEELKPLLADKPLRSCK